MSTPDRAEINRRNAQKSTGPRSAEGKSRSRLNALKHGMTATLLVLPGEDAEVLQGRIDTWTDELRPRNEIEKFLAERAAEVSWQLDRIGRAHVARLTANINNAAAGVTQPDGHDVLTLGWRLFWDARGPLPLYPHSPYENSESKPPVSWSGIVDDPNNPARIVHDLESSATGGQWLLERWAELRSILEHGQAWQSPDKLKAIRLLGRQPIDAFDDPKVALVFLASNQMDSGGGEPFHEIWNELQPAEVTIVKKRLAGRPLDWLQPRSEVEARQTLLDIIDRATGRLETMAKEFQRRAEVDAQLAPDLLAFDDSIEGERLRRYETSCSRTLIRILEALAKLRQTGEEPDAVTPAGIDEYCPVRAEAAYLEIAETEVTQPVDPQPQSSRQQATTIENPVLRNEANSIYPLPALGDQLSAIGQMAVSQTALAHPLFFPTNRNQASDSSFPDIAVPTPPGGSS